MHCTDITGAGKKLIFYQATEPHQDFKWYHYKCAQIHHSTEMLKKYIVALFCFTKEVY